MIQENPSRLGKQEIKKVFPNCHMIGYNGRYVYLKWSILNYLKKEDFYFGGGHNKDMYLYTEKEEVALLLEKKFPNSKVYLD